jgi:hypothetical protein
LINIQCGVDPVNQRFPQNFQMISTSGISEVRERESCQRNQGSSLRSERQALRMGWVLAAL